MVVDSCKISFQLEIFVFAPKAFCSRNSEYDVNSTIAVHQVTQFVDFQSKGCHLEGRLHFASTEGPQIAASLGTIAVKLCVSE